MKIDFETISTAEQCVFLKKMATQISREHFEPITGVAQVDYMMDKFLSVDVVLREIEQDNYVFEFVLADGERAGYLAAVNEGKRTFLSKLYLYKKFRGKGVASAMLARVKEIAKGSDSIYLTVNKGNIDTVAIYKNWGFVIEDSAVTDIGGGFVMDDYIMRLDL
ncbi:MAG: GNAT family N-acetyltransferase [Clostridia bacterium]|nr:GNAT family N-acetyltransferase [Clostridia bacterium]